MTTIKPAQAEQFLADVAAKIHRMRVKHRRFVGNLIERDIAACRIEAEIGWNTPSRLTRLKSR